MKTAQRKRRRMLWQAALATGLLLEVSLIFYALVVMINENSYDLHAGQQVAFVGILVWIYIAYLKQRSLDISAFVVDEKIKTHSLIQNLREGIIVVSPENQILLLNGRAAEITGLSELESLGKDLSEAADESIQNILASGRTGEAEGTLTDGGPIAHIGINLLPARKDGDPHKLIHVNAPAKSEAAPVSTRVAEENSKVAEAMQAMADAIEKSAQYAPVSEERAGNSSVALHGLVLALAIKREETKVRIAEKSLGSALKKNSVAIAPMLTEIVAELSPLTSLAGLDIELSPIDENIAVSGDRELLTDAMRQVLYSAAIASVGGSDSVRIRTAEMGGNIGLSFLDGGEAVDGEAVSDLFADPYVGVKGPGGDIVRTEGAGLYLARGIVEAHGGSLWAESPEGGGLRVTMMLP